VAFNQKTVVKKVNGGSLFLTDSDSEHSSLNL